MGDSVRWPCNNKAVNRATVFVTRKSAIKDRRIDIALLPVTTLQPNNLEQFGIRRGRHHSAPTKNRA